MSSVDGTVRRVRFFGVHDLATGFYIQRVAELVDQFDPLNTPTEILDVLEYHNVLSYLEHGLLPRQLTDSERQLAIARIGGIRSFVARFFSSIDNSNCASVIDNVGHEFHVDLLDLLGRYKAYERCDARTMLKVLKRVGIRLSELLTSRRLVAAYDDEVRVKLLVSPANAEHLIRKHLQKDARDQVHLPRSLTQADARDLLERYVDSPNANPNYLGLIQSAPVSTATGVDARLKLRASRRNAEMTEKLFDENPGIKIGTEVRLSDTQNEPVRFELEKSDGVVSLFTYSTQWLDETLDNPSILNNFQHLFEFADGQGLLCFPSYSAQLSVLERFMGMTGKTHYQVGAVYRAVDMSSLLQTRLYHHYLQNKGIDLEDVVSWFFEGYLVEEFDARKFSFRPSSHGASYLERVRHLFSEMESVLAKFNLWASDGEIDPEGPVK